MDENWRQILYPLGFLANLFFATRFIIQWFNSEKIHKSVLNPSFWFFSIAGSTLMSFHAFIQLQYPIMIVQACNVLLYWRSYTLMKTLKEPVMTIKKVFWILILGIFFFTGVYVMQSLWTVGQVEWMRVPNLKDSVKDTIPIGWTLMGFFGTFLFASRFWMLWWRAENGSKEPLNSEFWIVSLVGSCLALCYFWRISDWVNVIGFSAGMIPYIRNLMIMKQGYRRSA